MQILRKNYSLIVTLILTALLVSNLLLIVQNLNLRADLKSALPQTVSEGDNISSIQAKDMTGNTVSLNDSGDTKKEILLYFHPTCGYCKKQMPYWKELVSNVDPAKFKIVAVTTETNIDSIKNYLKTYNTESWETRIISVSDAQNLKLSGTPITLVINNGTVEKVWHGMWRSNEISEAGQYFAMNFATRNETKQ